MSMPMPGRRPRSRRRPWLIIVPAGAVVSAVAAAAFLVSSRPPAGSAPGPAPSSPAASPAARVPSPPAGTAVSTADWRTASVDGAVVPVSAADGPHRTTGNVASGFTDTPAGAVLAAVNISVRVSGQVGPAVFVPTIGGQVTGSAEQALLSAAWQEYGQDTGNQTPAAGGPAGPATAAVTSFKVTAWSPAQASVTLTAAGDSGSQVQATVAVRLQWLGGDWRLVAPAGGNFTAVPAAARVPAGFTALPGA